MGFQRSLAINKLKAAATRPYIAEEEYSATEDAFATSLAGQDVTQIHADITELGACGDETCSPKKRAYVL